MITIANGNLTSFIPLLMLALTTLLSCITARLTGEITPMVLCLLSEAGSIYFAFRTEKEVLIDFQLGVSRFTIKLLYRVGQIAFLQLGLTIIAVIFLVGANDSYLGVWLIWLRNNLVFTSLSPLLILYWTKLIKSATEN